MPEEEEDFESTEEFKEFCKVFDETKQELYETVRFKLGDEFKKNYGHNSIYNIKAFKNGTLEALEKTRTRISCTSAEKVIDILYIIGYSSKRIMYIIWKLGYYNISYRDYRKYIEREKGRLKKEQEQYMAELQQKKRDLFQQAQEEVLKTEERSLGIYLNLIKTFQNELEAIPDPTKEMLKCKRLCQQIDSLQDKIDEMHALTKKRDASIEVQTQILIATELAKAKALPVQGIDQQQALPSGERFLD